MLNEVEEYAISKNVDRLFVTVAEDKPESITFFHKKGFIDYLLLPKAYYHQKNETILLKDNLSHDF
jgi:L-amino acid N-acyltransferase YncA